MITQHQAMPDSLAAAMDTPAVSLGTELGIYEVGSMHQVLVDALAASASLMQPLQLDLSALQECDGAGLQLLLALARSAGPTSAEVHWKDAAPALLSSFRSLGVGRELCNIIAGGAR